MKKTLLIIMMVLLALSCAACSNPDPTEGPITANTADNVTAATIYYFGESKTMLDSEFEEDMTNIKSIVDELNAISTKTSTEAMDGNQIPLYMIELTYADGSMETIYSNDDGTFFFKFVEGDSLYFGGYSSELAKMLDQLK